MTHGERGTGDRDSAFMRRLWRLNRYLWFWHPARFRSQPLSRLPQPSTDDLVEEDPAPSNHGIPEADLSDEDRRRAAVEMKRRLGK